MAQANTEKAKQSLTTARQALKDLYTAVDDTTPQGPSQKETLNEDIANVNDAIEHLNNY
ncbi:hypothetical protein IV38_GL000355 [Lactobacillus selangorensis]|uniref:Uncharacterized protein n=1 Tax=Lactobacillus selangorensis TaxID=81857 RepID=A0A0R2G0D6_9LACO|nr:hypothetical protein [Lactobacillus selangorensis]KRN29471.1 hypothetical protein IV38_GL000355 [Lactobacillus selangorensis]KRN34000.1 hypothetical protein IV40_GL000313 [Lactobacillus selangorensis]